MVNFVAAIVDPITQPTPELLSTLFYQQGFVVVSGASIPPRDPLTTVATMLGLGERFVSNYNNTYFANKIKGASAEIGYNKGNVGAYAHPVFEGNSILGQHVDGTFSPLGEVKTSLLFCEQQALSGGESVLFNAYRAIKDMEYSHPHFVAALSSPEALRRRSTFKGISEEMIGPVFGVDAETGLDAVRLAFDDSADWEYGFQRVPYLIEAVSMLREFLDCPEFNLTFMLKEGDVLVMDNTRITHGRAPFEQDEARPRMMRRSVHRELPVRFGEGICATAVV